VLNVGTRLLSRNPYAANIASLNPRIVEAMFLVFVATILAAVVTCVRRPSVSRGTAWAIALLADAACSPLLEAEHLAPLALLPILMFADGVLPPPLLWTVGATLLACNVCSAVLPLHAAEVLSALLAVAGAALVWRRSRGEAVLALGFVGVAMPAIDGISAYWVPTISTAHTLFGTVQLGALLTLLVGTLVLLVVHARPNTLAV
jgi:hypothetical protein